MLTEIGLKRFDKHSIKSVEVERSIYTGKDREFDVTVLAGTGKVFQKMLSNSRIMGDDLRSAGFLAGMEKIRVILGSMMVSDRPGNNVASCVLATLGIYVLHTDCCGGTQSDK